MDDLTGCAATALARGPRAYRTTCPRPPPSPLSPAHHRFPFSPRVPLTCAPRRSRAELLDGRRPMGHTCYPFSRGNEVRRIIESSRSTLAIVGVLATFIDSLPPLPPLLPPPPPLPFLPPSPPPPLSPSPSPPPPPSPFSLALLPPGVLAQSAPGPVEETVSDAQPRITPAWRTIVRQPRPPPLLPPHPTSLLLPPRWIPPPTTTSSLQHVTLESRRRLARPWALAHLDAPGATAEP